MGKTALIAGATGLVGREVVRLLLSDPHYDKVKVVARRTTDIKDNRLEEIIIDFDSLKENSDKLSASDYYIVLGTTMSKARTKENFYKVDFTYPHHLAEIAQNDPSFEKYLIVTAYSASTSSSIYYNRVKGEIEEALKKLNLKALHIFQPSLLIGFRPEFRILEELMKLVMPILTFVTFGQLKFRAIEGIEVAKAMLKVGIEGKDGIHVYPNNIIKELAVSSLPPEDVAK